MKTPYFRALTCALLFVSTLSILFLVVPASEAQLAPQVPPIINYQGRVVVGSTNFNGTGSFKFALVTTVVNPFPHTVTLWSNDGTSTNGSEPTNAVSLIVSNGLYSVLLGDSSITNMTTIPTGTVFNNTSVFLRVWFNDGAHGSQQLSPDQRIAATGYAMMAANVPDGAITGAKIASGTITSQNIANGAVGSAQLASGAAAGNLAASGESGVASGGIVLSAADNPALVAAGYIKLGTITTGDSWRPASLTNGPFPRSSHTAVWTGIEMIVWGGTLSAGTTLNDGARYDPVANHWTRTQSSTLAQRSNHTAVWTGTEMIIWGGRDLGTNTYFNDGGRYNPATDTWATTQTNGAPSARTNHTAVWTGMEMIIWGGFDNSSDVSNGFRYNPTSDSWNTLDTASGTRPSAGQGHTAVWTGTEMIIWGGQINGTLVNDGSRYDPAHDRWTSTQSSGAPSVRANHTAVWTGTEMIVWGGGNSGTGGGVRSDGARYNPATDSWAATTPRSAPSGRFYHTAVWTDRQMILWGGQSNTAAQLGDGAFYDPVGDSWTATRTSPAQPRRHHTATWTGSEMIIFGGEQVQGSAPVSLNDPWAYTPAKAMVLYQKP